MSKRENDQPRSTVNGQGQSPYVIEERGPVFLIKQNENIVTIPAADLKKLIAEFTAMLERREHKGTTSQERHHKLYEPQSARQQRDKKQKSGEME